MLLAKAFVFAILLTTSCTKSSPPNKPTLYLASSLAVLFDDIQRLSGGQINTIFLSSSAIARQITQGAPCDAAIVADETWQNYLIQQGVVETTIQLFAHNSLVLVGPKSVHPQQFETALNLIPQDQRLIIGDPEFVPLGAYTKEALAKVGGFARLQGRLMRAHSARHAGLLLEQKASSWAVVYRTDVIPEGMHVVATIDPALHRPIAYPFLRCKKARPHQLKVLLQLIFSPALRQQMSAKGFFMQ